MCGKRSSPEDCGPDGLLDVLAHPPGGQRRQSQVECHLSACLTWPPHHTTGWYSGEELQHDSPVVLLLKVAHRDAPGATANRKLVSCTHKQQPTVSHATDKTAKDTRYHEAFYACPPTHTHPHPPTPTHTHPNTHYWDGPMLSPHPHPPPPEGCSPTHSP